VGRGVRASTYLVDASLSYCSWVRDGLACCLSIEVTQSLPIGVFVHDIFGEL